MNIWNCELNISHSEKIIWTQQVGEPARWFRYGLGSREVCFEFFNELKTWFENGYTLGIDNSHEAFNLKNINDEVNEEKQEKDNFLQWILDYETENPESKNKIQLWVGDLNCNNNIHDKFKHIVHSKITFNRLIPPVPDGGFIENRKFDKKFLYLNARIDYRDYRISLYTLMKSMGILQNCYHSFNARNESSTYQQILLENIDTSNLTLNDFEQIFYSETNSHYTKSFCNITTESYFDEKYQNRSDGMFFMSEKIFKPLIKKQPFIVVGKPNYLKGLHELGFKTFGDFWDESYDSEEMGDVRLSKIFNIIIDINKKDNSELESIYNKMIPILKHNFKHAFEITKINKNYSTPDVDDTLKSEVLSKLMN